MWNQFRRRLLGTVIEELLAAGVRLDFASIRIHFDDRSVFNVPRLDNYMRFSGEVTGTLLTALEPAQLAALQNRLRQVWPELLMVLDLPIGDRLTQERDEVAVTVTGTQLRVGFDLSAD